MHADAGDCFCGGHSCSPHPNRTLSTHAPHHPSSLYLVQNVRKIGSDYNVVPLTIHPVHARARFAGNNFTCHTCHTTYARVIRAKKLQASLAAAACAPDFQVSSVHMYCNTIVHEADQSRSMSCSCLCHTAASSAYLRQSSTRDSLWHTPRRNSNVLLTNPTSYTTSNIPNPPPPPPPTRTPRRSDARHTRHSTGCWAQGGRGGCRRRRRPALC